ncbi:MAG TPA: 16S rRNA (guanine(527)-N(7))-methyltransferase RsmG [Caulobacter sp.]|nr:16S rRNA (guanine(527)-N(7))-methyltransferase RsmG [Caulobacter sp.]
MSDAPAPPEAVTAAQDAADFQALTGATDAQMADLERFRALLEAGNAVMNLVGPATLPDFWNRHAWDSAQLLRLAPDARSWADLGAGAGFPGLILAILLKGTPGARVQLVESMAKRCRFLDQVARDLALPVQIHNARAEDLSLTVDIVTARACAPMVRLLGYARPYFQRGARGLFLKGQDVVTELNEAASSWTIKARLVPSLSDARGQIVDVESLARA